MIDQALKDRIKSAVSIQDVIHDYVSLTKKGANFVGKCPFHADSSPSLIVSPAREMYKCFACGAGGDVFKFIQEHEHVSFPEAVKAIARKANIEVPETPMTDEERRNALDREGMINANAAAQSLYASQLYAKPEGLAYLQSRGISPEMINEFGLGYAPDGNFITRQIQAGKLTRKPFEQLLIVKKNERGDIYDAFRGRVMYPFQDVSGKIIGFTGRKTDWQKGDPYAKFMNSYESRLFKKDRAIYGIFQAKKYISQLDRVYITEGQHDVISLHQNGVRNTVCGSGTAFSAAQAQLLMRFSRNFTLIYDGDAAGVKATIRTIETLLAEGANVRVVSLPEGEDPDSFARKFPENLAFTLSNLEKDFVDYLLKVREADIQDAYKRDEVIDELAKLIALIERETIRKALAVKVCEKLNLEENIFSQKLKAGTTKKEKIWKDGLYGMDEAREVLKKGEANQSILTFSETKFLENTEDKPIVYARGQITKSAIQLLRKDFNELTVAYTDNQFTFGDTEADNLLTLKAIFRTGMKINMENGEGDYLGFLDYYVSKYADTIVFNRVTENVKAEYINRCAEMISFADTTVRTVMMKTYAKKFDLTQAQMNTVLRPFLEKKKDRAVLEMRRIDTEDDLFNFDSEQLPDYVDEDKALKNIYLRDNFYPLINKQGNRVAYMFKNANGGGHTCISDFYMEPLLHVYSRESEANKRVILLNHIHGNSQYVEWKSSILATLSKVNEKLIDEGSYNFEGSLIQFKRIWKTMSYQFKKCTEMRVFGQQPEDFWAFSNAIIYDDKDADTEEKNTRVEYADHLGVMQYKDRYYYSPAFSEIYKDEREENDRYKMERYFVYKEPQENQRIDFADWARQMDSVYKVNDNGKWAIMLTMMACFRDYIFSQRRFFTTLFFIGPTGSGKSQLAESMRSMFMVPEAPVFNLNFGSDASFFIVLESYRNVISIMEEYNDTTISQTKFQGLKAAVFDGEGKTKVKDIASKALDRSKINAVPVILGQEAPQQDDGSLSNRVILCDVPYKAKGEWTDQETIEFENLKRHEQAGLCNVLLEVLSIRSIVKKHFNHLYTEEVKLIKQEVTGSVTNTEGLTRIINSIALTTTMCRIVEEHTDLQLPFSYDTFFSMATDKVLKQVEMISTSNKLSNYFTTIGYLINQGRITIGKELKVAVPKDGRVTVKTSGNNTEEKQLPSVETRVLYIDFGSIYPLYQQTVKDALTKASLQSYFNSNSAYIGLCRSTQFKWYDETKGEREVLNDLGDKEMKTFKKLEPHYNNTSAFMFNYDILKELMDVDFERKSDGVINQEDLPF